MPTLKQPRVIVVLSLLLCGLTLAAAHAQSSSSGAHRLVIRLDSTPPGAQVYLRTKDKLLGTTPTTIKLHKGSYRIIVELAGYKPVERVLTLDRSQGFVFTLEKEARPAVLDVRAAADQSAQGASMIIDGTPVGAVPGRVEVPAGSHLLEVKRPGYLDYRDTLQVQDGETRTVVVVLPTAQKSGSILVTADVPGAEIYVDGQRKDAAPAVIEGLSEGAHTVEVQKEGFSPWRQAVTVIGGQQTKVAATLTPPSPIVGSLKVLSLTQGADVVLDGEPKGPTNIEIQNVKPGAHVVEVRAPGFQSKRIEVQIAASEVRVVQVDLVAEVVKAPTGGLRIISPIPEAEVYLDGGLIGRAPVEKPDLAPGRHLVLVRHPGYADFNKEVEVEVGKQDTIIAELKAIGSLRILTNIATADVYLDGAQVGKPPLTLENVSVGQHVVELKAPGYLDARQNVDVTVAQQIVVQLDMQAVDTGPSQAEQERVRQLEQQREQVTFGALTHARGRLSLDIGSGYPYYISARLVAGVLSYRNFGFDLGVELRSTLHETDLGIRPRVQLYRIDPVAIGIDFTILGGGGPRKRNSFVFEVGPTVTLLGGRYVRFTVKPYYGYYTDRLCPSVAQIREDDILNGQSPGGQPVPGSGTLYAGEAVACKNYDQERQNSYTLPAQGDQSPIRGLADTVDPRNRFVTNRFLLQGALEILVRRNLNVWVLVEGAPGQGQRQSFTSKFNRFFSPTDVPIYARAGISLKF